MRRNRVSVLRCLMVSGVAVALLSLLGLPGGAARAAPAGPRPAPSGPTVGELISGTATYVAGTYAWTDYAYDDRGPDTNARPGGDATYPAEMDPNNVADLIQLQVRATGGADDRVAVTVVLETLQSSTRPVVGIAFDSDNDASTGASSLPGSWTPAEHLGVDHLFVLTTDGDDHDGQVMAVHEGGWSTAGTFDVAADPEANTLSATLPFALPDVANLRTVAAFGYADDNGDSWLNGASPVHDLAFIPGEDPTAPYLQGVSDAVLNFAAGGDPVWQDYRQSAILAGEEVPDVSPVAKIDVAKLRGDATEAPPVLTKGFHTFLYRSALDLGEGVVGSGNSTLFAGPYQPYLVWVPGGSTAGLPLVLYLHGASQTHLSAVNTAPYAPENRDPVLGLPNAFFDHFRAVVAWPLGRGPQQWYEGSSEQDVLDVHEDVVRRLDLNAERVMLAGLSMGGIGTFRLAELYPDRWSTAYSDVGFDQTGLPENLTALPIRFQNGGADYLVHVTNALATRDLLEEAGSVDYRSFILHQRHHQPAVAVAECIYQEAFVLDRAVNPPRVRYKADPRMFATDDESGLHLVYDGAYWVDGMQPANDDTPGAVDLTSHALGYLPVAATTTRTVQQNVTEGRDFCGSSAVQTRDTWDEQGKVVDRRSLGDAARAFVAGTLTGLSAVTVEADRAGIPIGTLEITTDRAMDLTLTGLVRKARVTVDGGSPTVAVRGVATISLAAGTNLVSIQRGGSR